MTLQFAANTVASALTAFAPTDPNVVSPHQPTVPLPSPPTQSAPSTPQSRLIDWNAFHPDGSDQTIHDLLIAIGNQLNAEAHLGRALPNGGTGRIFSSHSASAEPSGSQVGLKSSVVEACFATGRFLIANEQDVTSNVLENYRLKAQYQFVVGFAVPDLRGPMEMSAGMVLGFRDALPSNIDFSKYLTQLRLELASWLQAWQACRDCQSISTWSRMARFWQGQRAKLLVAGTCIGCLVMFVPIPYWPQRDCIVEPSARQFVSSPIDGRVLKSLVRPGDVVEVGQLIGQMDDEQLRWELGSAQAELQQAGKQQDSALAHQEGGKMRMAQLEQQKVSLKIQGLQAHLERLELRSPVAGIVLQGEWYRSEGAPVARGDTLFEIAPLEKMTVQVHLTTEDLGEITVDDSATVRIDSAYGEAWHGILSRIDPRAAVIDNEVRFVADMEVENRDNRLRPGMKGSVRIDAGRKSIGWLIFHRPYTWLMKYLVW